MAKATIIWSSRSTHQPQVSSQNYDQLLVQYAAERHMELINEDMQVLQRILDKARNLGAFSDDYVIKQTTKQHSQESTILNGG